MPLKAPTVEVAVAEEDLRRAELRSGKGEEKIGMRDSFRPFEEEANDMDGRGRCESFPIATNRRRISSTAYSGKKKRRTLPERPAAASPSQRIT